MTERWTTGPQYLEAQEQALRSTDLPEGDEDAERQIAEWLGRLRRLHGVPFHFLVPDARMLPTESIRVFVLDENWIECLVDGAFSIGRGATRDAAREETAARHFGERSAASARTARARALGLATEDEPAAGATEGITGFLLRSSVLTAWPGLELKGFSHPDGTGPLDLIRFDRVADDIALCLFRGRAALVTFSEPAETLHFGFLLPESEGAPFEKQLKYVDAPGHEPGSLVPGAREAATFRDGGRRVLDVAATATAIHKKLVETGGIQSGTPYTPAEFALEMVQGVEEVDLEVRAP
jgi:hypothetical protein